MSGKTRGTGACVALIQKIIDDSKEDPDIEKLNLSVVTTNEPAFSLYKKLGFEVVGIEKKSMKKGQEYYDEYLMTLLL